MDIIKTILDFFIHIDVNLFNVIQHYGAWTYLILFLVIFCETGFVVTPFLPGDSLLFAAGTFAAIGALDIKFLYILLVIAAISGNTSNYWIGYHIGPKIFSKKVRFLNKDHLERTHNFYERHGGKTIIIARFIPIIRTFAPFVAGIGSMTYWKFISYDLIGGTSWVTICTFAGYFFGNIPVVKRNFSLVIFAVIFISIMPGIIQFIRIRMAKKSS
jgi:membrane-associated protein